jgi:hypothetical protein
LQNSSIGGFGAVPADCTQYDLSKFLNMKLLTSHKIFNIIFTCLLLLLAGGASPVHCAWQSWEIADGENIHPSMQIDAEGVVHLGYVSLSYDENGDFSAAELRYVEMRNGTIGPEWVIDKLEANPLLAGGNYIALALDSNGQPHIAYCTAYDGALKHAFLDTAGWHTEIVTPNGATPFVSLAVAAGGIPCILYYDLAQSALQCAMRNGNLWELTPVDAGAAPQSSHSIVVAQDGTPHIAYYSSSESVLKHGWQEASVWRSEVVDVRDTGGLYASISLDSTGQPHIAYYTTDMRALKYAVRRDGPLGGDWRIMFVVTGIFDFLKLIFGMSDDGAFCSLKLDSQDLPHISYFNALLARIEYVSYNGFRWQSETPYSDTFSGPYNCLGLDADDKPYIALFTSVARTLRN